MTGSSRLKRLDQVLANFGFASRSGAKSFIRGGAVTVGGNVVRDPALRVDPALVCVSGEAVDRPDGIFVALNKPAGFACSNSESESPLVYELLPERWLCRNPCVGTVGRLDRETTGLVLITDIPELIHKLSSPRSGLEKIYEAAVDGPLRDDLGLIFGSGTLTLERETTPYLPAKFEKTGERTCRLTLTEGRNRQVRRMFESQGYKVIALKRVKFGPWELGDLPEGEWRDEDREKTRS